MGKAIQNNQSYVEKNSLTDNVMRFEESHYNSRMAALMARHNVLDMLQKNDEVVLFFPYFDTNLSKTYADELVVKTIFNDIEKMENHESKRIVIECSNMVSNSITAAFTEQQKEIFSDKRVEEEGQKIMRLDDGRKWPYLYKDGITIAMQEVTDRETESFKKKMSRLKVIANGCYHS